MIFLVLCCEGEYADVVVFATKAAREAYSSGFIDGADAYGAGSPGTYDWPEESAELRADLGDADYDNVLGAIEQHQKKSDTNGC